MTATLDLGDGKRGRSIITEKHGPTLHHTWLLRHRDRSRSRRRRRGRRGIEREGRIVSCRHRWSHPVIRGNDSGFGGSFAFALRCHIRKYSGHGGVRHRSTSLKLLIMQFHVSIGITLPCTSVVTAWEGAWIRFLSRMDTNVKFETFVLGAAIVTTRVRTLKRLLSRVNSDMRDEISLLA